MKKNQDGIGKQRPDAFGQRIHTLDLVRGLTLVSMILYHGLWDFLYLSETGAAMSGLRAWYEGAGGHLWQQSICRTFILLSGFCVPLSGHILRRGLQVSAAGCAVSAVTFFAAYEQRVLFGVLTFLGAAMLLTGALKEAFCAGCGKKGRTGSAGGPPARSEGRPSICLRQHGRTKSAGGPPAREGAVAVELQGKTRGRRILFGAGLFICALLFHVTRYVNAGFLRLGPSARLYLPESLYGGGPLGLLFTALGFPVRGFFSTDYFSLIPWVFLFWAGMFLHLLVFRGGTRNGSSRTEAAPRNRGVREAAPRDGGGGETSPRDADSRTKEDLRQVEGSRAEAAPRDGGGGETSPRDADSQTKEDLRQVEGSRAETAPRDGGGGETSPRDADSQTKEDLRQVEGSRAEAAPRDGGVRAGALPQEGVARRSAHPLLYLKAPVLNWMGRHSLLVYLLHQPILYLLIAGR